MAPVLALLWSMAGVMRFFFVLRGACASPSQRPPWPGDEGSLRCWRLASSVALCCASAQQCTDELRWICVKAAAMLMVAAGTTVDKSILVPFVALQAPSSFTFLAMKDPGRLIWIACLGLLARFLYIITGEWRRALSTTFLVAIAMVPSQVMNLRESQGRAILSAAIAVYLAFQHFTGVGGFRKAFLSVRAIFATLCIVCITTISLMSYSICPNLAVVVCVLLVISIQCIISTTILMLATGTTIQKLLLVSLIALQAPSSIVLWMRDDHGRWTAFLGLLLCLLYRIPGELELPLSVVLLVTSAPYQFIVKLRKSQGAAILSTVIASYLMFQHFTRVRSLRRAFDREVIIVMSNIICMTVTSLMLVFLSNSSSSHIAAANMKNSIYTEHSKIYKQKKKTNISFVINLLTQASWQCSLKFWFNCTRFDRI